MVAVKLGLWPELAAEASPDSTLPYARALWHYAQGVRKARSGDAPGARADLSALRHLMHDSLVQKMTIWGINRASHILRIAEHELMGEVASAEGKAEEAVGHFKLAVASEDSLQYQEPPDWTFPARHVLGNALLRAGKAAEAEKVFTEDLVFWPENGYGLEGLRAAYLAQKKNTDAEKLQARITAAWQHADR